MKPITDNELIAEFMGEIVYATRDEMYAVPIDDLKPFYFLKDLKYHSSWDWLMPVVEKIIQIKGSHFIYDHTVLEIFMYGKRIVRIGDATMIGNYYNGVVEFIKWYNTHKNENI
jgi:hypothetical protein